jgi:hypothetical protein
MAGKLAPHPSLSHCGRALCVAMERNDGRRELGWFLFGGGGIDGEREGDFFSFSFFFFGFLGLGGGGGLFLIFLGIGV